MKPSPTILKHGLLGAMLLGATQLAQAAAIGVGTGVPDVVTFNSNIVYDYVAALDESSWTADSCEKKSGSTWGAADCGTAPAGLDESLLNDTQGFGGDGQWRVTANTETVTHTDGFGDLDITGGGDFSMWLTTDGVNSIQIVDGGSGISFALHADIFEDGSLEAGTLSIFGETAAGGDGFDSGTLMTSVDLTAIGWDGNGAAGALEFVFDNLGGDFAAFGTSGFVSAGIFDMAHDSNTGEWDDTNDNLDLTFWQGGFTATSDVDAFVSPIPVPAAVWLFGSGILALAGVARRKATI